MVAAGQQDRHVERPPRLPERYNRTPITPATILVLSAQFSRTLEEVAQTATGPLWFQQYFFKERSLTLDMARRAEEAGYAALCLTLDAKVKPKRERNMRNHYAGPASPNYAHLDVTGSPWSFGWTAPRAPTTCGTRPPPGRTWAGWRLTPACSRQGKPETLGMGDIP